MRLGLGFSKVLLVVYILFYEGLWCPDPVVPISIAAE